MSCCSSPSPRSSSGARRVRHGPLDLEPHDLAEAPLAQLLLEGHQQVVRLVLLDREVRVAGDPEEVVLEHLHAGEEDVEVGGDDLLEQHVRPDADFPEPRQHRRHLDPREAPLPGVGVADRDREREREVADVRERVPGIDGERRQDGEDLVQEALAQLDLALVPVLVRHDPDALVGELRRGPPANVFEWSVWSCSTRLRIRSSTCGAPRARPAYGVE